MWEKDIFAVHPKWLERHMRHFRDALYHLERGDGMAACYNAYVSVEALLKGVLGYSPYGDLHKVDRLPSLLKRAIGASPPGVEECAECLERKAFSEEGLVVSNAQSSSSTRSTECWRAPPARPIARRASPQVGAQRGSGWSTFSAVLGHTRRRDLPFFGVEEGGGLIEEDDLALHTSAFARVTSFL